MPSRGDRNNNPGNLEASAWTRSQPGFVRSDGRYAVFDTMANGIRAQASLLGSYIRRGYDTVHEIIWRYGNDPGAHDDVNVRNYVTYVSRRLGVASTATLSPSQSGALGQAMREFETGARQSGVINGNGGSVADRVRAAIGGATGDFSGQGEVRNPVREFELEVDRVIGGAIGGAGDAITGGWYSWLNNMDPLNVAGRSVAVIIGVILVGLAIAAFVLTSDNAPSIEGLVPNVT